MQQFMPRIASATTGAATVLYSSRCEAPGPNTASYLKMSPLALTDAAVLRGMEWTDNCHHDAKRGDTRVQIATLTQNN